jgi:corrinoid protein of di/trimethylamine methyltransferase
MTEPERVLTQIANSIVDLDATSTAAAVRTALALGISPIDIIRQGLSSGMEEIGRKFEANEYYLPELLMSAKAMKQGMEIVRPLLVTGTEEGGAKVLIGTVKGDLHDIGKNLVATLLVANGFQVKDIGINVPNERFVQAVQSENPDILAMSALLLTTRMEMGNVIAELNAAGLRRGVKVLVGGRPVDQRFANQIGADAYGKDAWEAVTEAKKLIRENKTTRTE